MPMCKLTNITMDPNIKLGTKANSALINKSRYQRLVGKLIYLLYTKPYIGFLVNVVNQFMKSPIEEHMGAIQWYLRYLTMRLEKGLFFKENVIQDVKIFTKVHWVESSIDRKSTSSYCTFVWHNLVKWWSKKQSIFAKSTAKAKFQAMAHGICKRMWLRRLLRELKILVNKPMILFYDDLASLSLTKNPVDHDRTKHMEIDYHFITKRVENKVIILNYTLTHLQVSNKLTKALPQVSFNNLCFKLGTINFFYLAWIEYGNPFLSL